LRTGVPMLKTLSLPWLLGILVTTGSLAGSRSIGKSELASELSYYQSIQTLQTKFHETKTLRDIQLKDLTVIRPNKVIWKVTRPSPLTVTLEETRLQILEEGKTESFAIEGEAKQALKSLVVWLKLDPDELFATYQISSLGENRFAFVPKSLETSPIQRLEMTLRTNSYVERLQIDEKSGDHLDIRFEKPRIERSHAK
jgi:hypothetical protein